MTKLIGACCRQGQRKLGVEKGPHVIEQCLYDGVNLMKNINNNGNNTRNSNTYKYIPKTYIKDIDNSFSYNAEPMDYINHFDANGKGYKELHDLHNHYLTLNHNVITIGGDHSVSLSTVASSAKTYQDDLVVVWVDAHPDLHTRQSSTSQNMHGMPVGSLLGIDNIFNFSTIKPHQLIYIGLRDIDEYEKKQIRDLHIEYYNMSYIHRNGIKQILHNISNMQAPIHLSFDVDSIDPAYFKSTGTPVRNGLTLSDAWDVFTILNKNIVSTDIVEFNPHLTDEHTNISEGILLSNFIKYLS